MIDYQDFAGVFASGYDAGDIDQVLGQLSREFGADLACLWDRIEDGEPVGDSQLVVLAGDGSIRELPAGLWELLLEGTLPAAAPDFRSLPPLEEAAGLNWRELESTGMHNLAFRGS